MKLLVRSSLLKARIRETSPDISQEMACSRQPLMVRFTSHLTIFLNVFPISNFPKSNSEFSVIPYTSHISPWHKMLRSRRLGRWCCHYAACHAVRKYYSPHFLDCLDRCVRCIVLHSFQLCYGGPPWCRLYRWTSELETSSSYCGSTLRLWNQICFVHHPRGIHHRRREFQVGFPVFRTTSFCTLHLAVRCTLRSAIAMEKEI